MTQLLSEVIRGGRLGSAIQAGRVVLLFEKVVPENILRQTEAIKVNRQVLYVGVKSPVWAQELNFLKREIIERINKEAGYTALKDIRFKAGG